MTIFAIGRNFAAHAREMGARPPAPDEPVVFLKPESALVSPPGPIRFPAGVGEVHHEVELVVVVGPERTAAALAVGLDLTDRARQTRAKREGLPWAASKGFRGSAPLGPAVPLERLPPLGDLIFSLHVDGVLRQRGASADMLVPIPDLLAYLDRWFGLAPGDRVFTGTPEGVGPLAPGNVLDLALAGVPAAAARFQVA